MICVEANCSADSCDCMSLSFDHTK